jgi:hypothetical protein
MDGCENNVMPFGTTARVTVILQMATKNKYRGSEDGRGRDFLHGHLANGWLRKRHMIDVQRLGHHGHPLRGWLRKLARYGVMSMHGHPSGWLRKHHVAVAGLAGIS